MLNKQVCCSAHLLCSDSRRTAQGTAGQDNAAHHISQLSMHTSSSWCLCVDRSKTMCAWHEAAAPLRLRITCFR